MDAPSNSHRTTRAPLSPAEGGAPLMDVVVIGGGASGLAAAVTASRAGARCCVLEQDVECGLRLLATGNGRCNISNAQLDPRHFRHEDAVRHVFGDHAERDIASFFEGLGLMLAEEDEGRLYPVTRRAESVRDVFLNACDRLQVDLMCGVELVRASYADCWELTLNAPSAPLSFKPGRDAKARIRNARKALAAAPRAERTIRARRVVIATGGQSDAICEIFGIPHLQEQPVLCPISCRLAPEGAREVDAASLALEHLDGLRVEGTLSLMHNGAAIAFEHGEVLFRTYGISGIAALNLSRRLQPGDVIDLDLFPHLSEAQLLDMLRRRERDLGSFAGSAPWLDGLVARPLAALVCHLANGSNDPVARCAAVLHRLPLRVLGTAEHRQAHVHRGGIPLSAIDLDRFAVTRRRDGSPVRDLHACGEAVDMDADCGGYNLAWAWISGMRAAACAAKGASC